MASTPINAWTTPLDPGDGAQAPYFASRPTVPAGGASQNLPVRVIHYNIEPGKPGEYARLYLVVTFLLDGSIVLERMVLVVGPTHWQRTSPPNLVDPIIKVLKSLDERGKLAGRRSGSLYRRASADGSTVEGVLDAVVLNNSGSTPDAFKNVDPNRLPLIDLLNYPSQYGLTVLFKRRRDASTGEWQPLTTVYLRWIPGKRFFMFTEMRNNPAGGPPFLVFKPEKPPGWEWKLALVQDLAGTQGGMLGWNLFNLNDNQQGFGQDKVFTSRELTGAQGDGLNVQQMGSGFSPRLYILHQELATCTLLVADIGTSATPQIWFQFCVDTPTFQKAVATTINLYADKALWMVSLHWGHVFDNLAALEEIAFALVRKVENVYIRLDGFAEGSDSQIQRYFAPSMLALTCLLSRWHPRCMFSSGWFPANLRLGPGGLFAPMVGDIAHLRVATLSIFVIQAWNCFPGTMNRLNELATVKKAQNKPLKDVVLEQLPDLLVSKLNATTFRQELAHFCAAAWEEMRRKEPTLVPPFLGQAYITLPPEADWLVLDPTAGFDVGYATFMKAVETLRSSPPTLAQSQQVLRSSAADAPRAMALVATPTSTETELSMFRASAKEASDPPKAGDADDVLPTPYIHLFPDVVSNFTEAETIAMTSSTSGPDTALVVPPPPTNVTAFEVPSTVESTPLTVGGLRVFSFRLQKPVSMRDRENQIPVQVPPEGTKLWYKLNPTKANNPYFSYLRSVFGKVPTDSTVFVEVEKPTGDQMIWTTLGVEFKIGTTKHAFSNSTAAQTRQFGKTVTFPAYGYFPKDALLVLSRDSTADKSKFTSVRTGTANAAFKFSELTTFLGFQPPVYLAAFFSPDNMLIVDEGDEGRPRRNGVWLWPSEAQRVETRLALVLDSPKPGTSTSTSPADTLLSLVAPGFGKLDATGFQLIAKRISNLDVDGTTVTSTSSLDFVFPVVRSDGSTVKRFTLILSIESKGSATVRVQNSADGSLQTIIEWIKKEVVKTDGIGSVSDAGGIPGPDALVAQSKLTFESKPTGPGFSLDFRQLVFTLAGKEKTPGAAQSPKLTAFQLEMEAQGPIGSDERKVSALLSFKWDELRGTSFVGSLWNELWQKKATTIDETLQISWEAFRTVKPTTGTRTSFNLGDLVPDIEMPDWLPLTLTSFYLEISSSGVSLSATTSTPGVVKGSPVPIAELSALRLRAMITSENQKRTVGIGFAADAILRTRKPQEFPPALLNITIDYSSASTTISNQQGTPSNVPTTEKSWSIVGSAKNLRAAHLFALFPNSDDGEAVMGFLEPVVLSALVIDYKFTSAKASSFVVKGLITIGRLMLSLDFTASASDFTLRALLTQDEKQVSVTTLGDILEDCYSGARDLLPAFILEMEVKPADASLEFEIAKTPKPTERDPKPQTGVVFNLTLTLKNLVVSLVQHQGPKPSTGAAVLTRIIRVSYKGFPVTTNVPVVGTVAPSFEQLEFVWASQNISKKLQDDLNASVYEKDLEKLLTKTLATKDSPPNEAGQPPKLPDGDKVVLTKGCHFMIIGKQKGERAVMIDYAFGSGKPEPPPPASGAGGAGQPPPEKAVEQPVQAQNQNGELAVAPVKANQGPLSIKNISFGVTPTEPRAITIKLDATFQLGPVSFSLLGFTLTVTNIGNWDTANITPALEGMAVDYARTPIVMAGMFRQSGSQYSGAMVLTFPPYSLMAMGAYQSSPFKSLVVVAVLSGPLAQFEVAEISGVTAGFGYNSRLTTPLPSEVNGHPFLANPSEGDGKALINTARSGTSKWFPQEEGSNWLAAGLTVKAFQTLAIKAVLAVSFGPSVELSLFAEASVLAPAAVTGKSVKPFISAQLGIIGVLKIEEGIFTVGGQLSSTSYILDPSCQLRGGFATAYWFAGSGALEGDWVFTVGGYHPLFSKPNHYPQAPPRVSITWGYSDEISIRGEAYFAVTPQCLMGGGRLSATFQKYNIFGLGADVFANFEAWADFLINFHPFRYIGDVGASISAKVKADAFFTTLTLTFDASASLHVEGPPFSGLLTVKRVPIVGTMTIKFGQSDREQPALSWDQFLDVVLQSTEQSDPTGRRTHIISLSEGRVDGILKESEKSAASSGDDAMVVRAGQFKINIQSKIPIKSFTTPKTTKTDVTTDLFFKPMKSKANVSSLVVTITGPNLPAGGVTFPVQEADTSNVPSGLWGEYKPAEDPSSGAGAARNLLGNSSGRLIPHLMTLTLTSPEIDTGKPETHPPWATFWVKLDRSTEVFGENGKHLPYHRPSNHLHGPNSLVSGDGALQDLEAVWKGPAIDPKGAIDCWMQLFHPLSDAMIPIVVPPVSATTPGPSAIGANAQTPTVEAFILTEAQDRPMTTTMPAPYSPLPGTLPARTIADPSSYYMDFPRVSNHPSERPLNGTVMATVSWVDSQYTRQARCYVQRSDGMLVEHKLGDDGEFHLTSTFEPVRLNPGGRVAALRALWHNTTAWLEEIYFFYERGGVLHAMVNNLKTETWTDLLLPQGLTPLLEGTSLAVAFRRLSIKIEIRLYAQDALPFPAGTQGLPLVEIVLLTSAAQTSLTRTRIPNSSSMPKTALAAMLNYDMDMGGGDLSVLVFSISASTQARVHRFDLRTNGNGWQVDPNSAWWANSLTPEGAGNTSLAGGAVDLDGSVLGGWMPAGNRALLFVHTTGNGGEVMPWWYRTGWGFQNVLSRPLQSIEVSGSTARLAKMVGIVSWSDPQQGGSISDTWAYFQTEDGRLVKTVWRMTDSNVSVGVGTEPLLVMWE